MGAAVEHVHHRHRQRRGPPRRRGSATAAGAPPRPPPARPRARRRGSRWRRGGALFGGAVELDQRAVEALLVERVAPAHRVGDLAVDVADGLRDALAAPGVAAVAQLGGLELAGRGAGRHRRAALRARGAARPRPRRSGCRASRGSGGRARVSILLTVSGLLVQAGARVVGELVVGAEIVPVRALAMRRGAPRPRRGRGSGRRRPAARAPGSTLSLRARLTAANSTSPTSWKASSRVRGLAQLLELAPRPRRRGRASKSKPVEAARRWTLRAYSGPGRFSGTSPKMPGSRPASVCLIASQLRSTSPASVSASRRRRRAGAGGRASACTCSATSASEPAPRSSSSSERKWTWKRTSPSSSSSLASSPECAAAASS